jgi:predicted nucleic acid-binding protein
VNFGRVFVDTGAWFALQVTDDAHHVAARETLPAVLAGSRGLVTSNLVVGETYTLLRLARGYPEARRFLDRLAHSGRLERVFVSQPVEHEAYEILHRYAEHAFSFVDATSFAVMRAQRLRHAFAFDAHFRIAGFSRVPIDLRP